MNTTTETRVPSPEIAQEQQPNPAQAMVAATPENLRPAIDPVTQQPIAAHSHIQTASFAAVVGAVADVMAEITSVTKGGENTHFGYKYARMQDILQTLTPLMGKHGLVVFQYENVRTMFDDGKVMAIMYNFIVAHKSGETWISPVPQTGMAPCRHKQGGFDDKCVAKCHTSARKYFLLSLFQVPTEDENDPDGEKAQRSAAPVPSPDGTLPPHLIEPTQRDTFDAWAARYLAGVRTSKTVADLDAWDTLNDGPLSQMSNDPKGGAVYDRVLKECGEIRARLAAAAAPSASGGGTDTKAVVVTHDGRGGTTVEPVTTPPAPEPFVRPDGCPDPDKDPDGFLAWATKRMEGIAEADALTVVWENEIAPASDGLFKPDFDSLEETYNQRLAKIGG